MADEKASGVISVDHLAGAITEAVLRAVGTRLNLDKHIEAGNVVIFRPVIRYGGDVILARGADLPRIINAGASVNEG